MGSTQRKYEVRHETCDISESCSRRRMPQKKQFPCVALFGGKESFKFADRRATRDHMLKVYEDLQRRTRGNYTTHLPRDETSMTYSHYDLNCFGSSIVGALHDRDAKPSRNMQTIEAKLKPFCLVNKRFFPELWTCSFMQKQVLEPSGEPKVGTNHDRDNNRANKKRKESHSGKSDGRTIIATFGRPPVGAPRGPSTNSRGVAPSFARKPAAAARTSTSTSNNTPAPTPVTATSASPPSWMSADRGVTGFVSSDNSKGDDTNNTDAPRWDADYEELISLYKEEHGDSADQW